MMDSTVIVEINKDSEALIFIVTDYTLEADLFAAVPERVNARCRHGRPAPDMLAPAACLTLQSSSTQYHECRTFRILRRVGRPER